eukprot:TRINITY_DN15525_c0_g1_i1.p1 TRINITY_DN15525_c0_g1~~TRINITY_DN15525_c0_g1_i1.p1  ORF type:complete len:543 (+),score=108.97 TRINITY_DN15525_c0_g1_i1:192-1820(+)
MEFWGVKVKPGEILHVYPGKGRYIHLSQAATAAKGVYERTGLFVHVNDKKIGVGTLHYRKCDHISFSLIFEKEFGISHTSQGESVYFSGYIIPEGNSGKQESLKYLVKPLATSSDESSKRSFEEAFAVASSNPECNNQGNPETLEERSVKALATSLEASLQKLLEESAAVLCRNSGNEKQETLEHVGKPLASTLEEYSQKSLEETRARLSRSPNNDNQRNKEAFEQPVRPLTNAVEEHFEMPLKETFTVSGINSNNETQKTDGNLVEPLSNTFEEPPMNSLGKTFANPLDSLVSTDYKESSKALHKDTTSADFEQPAKNRGGKRKAPFAGANKIDENPPVPSKGKLRRKLSISSRTRSSTMAVHSAMDQEETHTPLVSLIEENAVDNVSSAHPPSECEEAKNVVESPTLSSIGKMSSHIPTNKGEDQDDNAGKKKCCINSNEENIPLCMAEKAIATAYDLVMDSVVEEKSLHVVAEKLDNNIGVTVNEVSKTPLKNTEGENSLSTTVPTFSKSPSKKRKGKRFSASIVNDPASIVLCLPAKQ